MNLNTVYQVSQQNMFNANFYFSDPNLYANILANYSYLIEINLNDTTINSAPLLTVRQKDLPFFHVTSMGNFDVDSFAKDTNGYY